MKCLDLFSGIGGFSLGFERAGIETVAFCEYDEHARAILKKHWPDVPCYKDVRTLDARKYRGTVDIVCGGFPCQDLSSAGKQAGFGGERSSLYREMLRIVGECRPRYAVFENVTGLLTGDRGRWFAKFLYDLAEIGYDAEWHCISASYIGAPHHRDRVWVIAYPQCQRSQRQGKFKPSIIKETHTYREASGIECAFRKGELPYVCRGHNGVPFFVDKNAVKALGNSIDPRIAEIIGRAIVEASLPNLCTP